MKAGDIIDTKKGPALYLGGDTTDIKNYKFPVFSGKTTAGMQGLTFRFADELTGAIRGGLSSEMTIDQAIDLERKAFEKYGKEQPLAAIASELAGAAAPAVLTLGASAPISATGIGAAALRAVPAGVAYGAGAAEGDPLERALPAIGTGLTSGAFGAGMQVLARPVAKIGSEIAQAFRKPEKVGQKKARELVEEALEYDKTNINSAIQYITARSGKKYALADIGPNTRAYLDAVNVLPGKGKKEAQDFLKLRNQGMLTRLKSDLKDAYGAQASYFDTYKAIEAARKANGDILYKKAFERKIPATEELTTILEKPSARNAFTKAYELAAEEGVKLPRINLKNGKMLTPDGGEVKAIDTKLLHYMKMSLDDGIYTGRSPTSGIGSTQLGMQKSTRGEFLDYMDKYNPIYKQARDEWSSKTAVLDKLELGRKYDASNQNIEELAEEIVTMSKSELEAFRNGVLNNIVEKMEKTIMATDGRGANVAYNLIKTPRSRRLLRLTFDKGPIGQKKFNKFISNLEDEIQLKDTSNLVVGNSATAGRQEAVGAIKELMQPSDIQNLSPVGLIYSLFKADNPAMQNEAAQAAAKELSRILTTTNPAALKSIAKEINDKQSFKGILKKYIPKASDVGRATISPRVLSASATLLGGERIPPSPSMQTLLERMSVQE